MRLSEAIRLGSLLKPQTFGDYENLSGTCALGAACEAMGVDLACSGDIAKFEISHALLLSLDCPVCHDAVAPDVVVHLNDDHRWTREAIADWLESQERELGLQSPVAGEAPAVVSDSLASDAQKLITVSI
jgi:hypothetical protein